ncbi:DegT/DnrJ/EryC1/StrS family aminotransferase [Candidatus Pelagibacter sp.]|nr:DegT/DnrJ/EryC1/StrS family aminotransferase [Candidatus Pelagibacter sp.]
MPGFEVINFKEKKAIEKIFTKGSGVLFRHGFEKIRKKSYQVRDFENKFKNKFKAKYALAVSSGTAALRIALASCNIGSKDEVITQSFTFVATVEAIVESGARPLCTEIDETLNMCPIDLEKKITKKTKAVIVVHMLGVPANLDKIKNICKKNNLLLIEDTAWGIGGKYKNKYLGTIGEIGTYSFDFAKTLTTGEGGMIVFNKKHHFLKAKAWHDHGHENNPKVPRWEDTRKSSGFNFRMSELQGAVGLAQLEKFDDIFKSHKKNKDLILKKLRILKGFKIRTIPKYGKEAAESLILIMKNKDQAIKFRKNLLKHGYSTKILPEATSWHFAGQWKHIDKLKINNKNKYPKSNEILSKSVSIPIFYNMKKNFPKIIFNVIKDLNK